MGILIGVFCVVIFMDWRYYKIPNVCIVAGMLTGLNMTYMSYSVIGLFKSASAVAVTFFAFYPFYKIGAIGAGDVKLFMMIGCYSPCMGTDGLIRYMLITMAIAAVWSAGKMVIYAKSRERLFYLIQYLRKVAVTGVVDEYQIDKTQKQCVIRLSIPAFLSFVLMCVSAYI